MSDQKQNFIKTPKPYINNSKVLFQKYYHMLDLKYHEYKYVVKIVDDLYISFFYASNLCLIFVFLSFSAREMTRGKFLNILEKGTSNRR